MQPAGQPQDEEHDRQAAQGSSPFPSDARPASGEERPWVETVLVVDDDEAVRKVMCRSLVLQGYQVLEAPDGDSALELVRARKGRLDLVISDVNMPGLSGGRLVGELATMRPDLAFLYVSGYRVESPRSLTLADGAGRAIPFLSKPFSPTDLVRAVVAALERRRTGRG